MIKKTVQIAHTSREEFAVPGEAQPGEQEEIAARAFQLWLDRSFRDGSPQEDWLRAQREVKNRRSRAS